MGVTKFPQKTTGPGLAEALEIVRQLASEGTPDEQRTAKRMLKATIAPKGGFMRIWIDRSNDINEDLDARADTCHAAGKAPAVSVNLCIRVLGQAVGSLPENSQRMSITQAAIAAKLRITPTMASQAFAELHAVGAVLARQREGKSITWEIDARYASRLNDAEREKAIKGQAAIRRAEGQNTKKQAALDKVVHRLVPWPDTSTGPIEDERQPALADWTSAGDA